MQNKGFFLLGLLLVISSVFLSCSTSTSTQTTQPLPSTGNTTSSALVSSSVTTQPSTSQTNWWDKFGKPQYGYEMVVWAGAINGGSFDPDVGFGLSAGVPGPRALFFEPLATLDWTLDRNIWAYQTGFTPLNYMVGELAESWEQKDPTTIILHIRQGVYWQDKTPVNAREFTAQDVKYSFDRVLGTGSGFTEPNPALAGMYSAISNVTTTDQFTVEFKLKDSSIMGMFQILSDQAGLVAQEWDKQADQSDWKSAVGTGAFILTNFQVGTSMTYSNNPNYWGYDPRYPKNKLPYLTTIQFLAIPDITTAIAALRTGKIDIINDPMGGLTWQQAKTLSQTNPDLQMAYTPQSAEALLLRCDKKPFTDIRVREALQLAINLPSIAKSYYGGTIDGDPVGIISENLDGWVTPYSEWPADLQQQYSYNPERGKQLLVEAGYPNGFDTDVVAAQGADIDLLEIVKAEFGEIGVNLTINAMDMVTARNMMSSGKQDQMAWDKKVGNPGSVTTNISNFCTGNLNNYTYNNDPTYDAMFEQVGKATSLEDMQKAVIAANTYALQQHWSVNFCSTIGPFAWQSWLKGYSGEFGIGQYLYYLWIDQSLKK
jgi:peptide/nickel transport system substrate-binding protein